MKREKRRRAEQLFDWHLHQLSQEDSRVMEAELLRNPDLRAQSDRLGQVFRPLDYWTVSPPPSQLAEKVLASIANAGESRSSSEPVFATADGKTYRSISFLSFRELMAVAACIALLIGIAIPGLARARSRSQQAICASNLGSIFQGTRLYQAAFGGSLPYAGAVPHSTWLPHSQNGGPYASNSRHIFLLAKLNYGPGPSNFVCPSSRAAHPMPTEQLASFRDFASARNLSYASCNLSGVSPNLKPRLAMAYMSDLNPLFVDGRFHPALDPDKTNSPAHGGRGQAVLMLDGNVVRLTTPIYGPRRDNLWLAGHIRTYTGTETATRDDDAFLINGYPATELGQR